MAESSPAVAPPFELGFGFGDVAVRRVTLDEKLERRSRGGLVVFLVKILGKGPQGVARGVLGPKVRIGIARALHGSNRERREQGRNDGDAHGSLQSIR